jgi:hypothetical protein
MISGTGQIGAWSFVVSAVVPAPGRVEPLRPPVEYTPTATLSG